MSNNIQLIKKIVFTGVITLKTGLHIGGTNSALNIGGPDKFVVRNPISTIPYIPGSSLKGKMRALVEIFHRCVDISTDKAGKVKVGPSKEPNSISGKLFGVPADADNKGKSEHFSSRLIVRDCNMITREEYKKMTEDKKVIVNEKYGIKDINDIPDYSHTDLPYTESKTEVNIDRVTSSANPRTFERIPAGSKFYLDFVLNIFENDKENELMNTIDEAISLLADDYLGGQGSRGYGQIEITIVKKEMRDNNYYSKE